MANRNRNAGLYLERTVVQTFNKRTLGQPGITNKDIRSLPDNQFSAFPKLGTTRELSRALDARKVDITTVVPERIGEFPYNIQTKTLVGGAAKYPLFLDEIRQVNKVGVPIFIHQQTEKKGERFFVKDEFVCMYLSDWMDMVYKIKDLEMEFKQREHFEQ